MKHETIGRKRNWNSTENEKEFANLQCVLLKLKTDVCEFISRLIKLESRTHVCWPQFDTLQCCRCCPRWPLKTLNFMRIKNSLFHFVFFSKNCFITFLQSFSLFFFVIFIIAFLFSFSTESLWMNSPMLCMLSSFIFFARVENVKLLTKWIVNHGSWSKWVRKMVESAIIKECRFDTNQ